MVKAKTISKRVRRNSGREFVKIYDTKEFPETIEYWNDWNDWRDGMRQPFDNTKIRNEFCMWNDWLEVPKYNSKLKRLLQRRKAMKESLLFKNNTPLV